VTARARVGLIVPSSNPVIEGYLQRTPVTARLGIDVLVTRARVRRIAADDDADAQFGAAALSAAAGLLADAEVSLISWAGTSGCWLGGGQEDAVLARASAAAGVPVTSSRTALLAALAEQPGAPLGVLTPYVTEVHDRVVATVRAAGGTVVADRGLGLERNLDFAAIPAAVLEASLRALASAGAQSLAVVCTNVPGVLPSLAAAPFTVVDSVLATLWHAARLTGSYRRPYADCYRQACAPYLAGPDLAAPDRGGTERAGVGPAGPRSDAR
jgi:maleate isomerase